MKKIELEVLDLFNELFDVFVLTKEDFVNLLYKSFLEKDKIRTKTVMTGLIAFHSEDEIREVLSKVHSRRIKNTN